MDLSGVKLTLLNLPPPIGGCIVLASVSGRESPSSEASINRVKEHYTRWMLTNVWAICTVNHPTSEVKWAFPVLTFSANFLFSVNWFAWLEQKRERLESDRTQNSCKKWNGNKNEGETNPRTNVKKLFCFIFDGSSSGSTSVRSSEGLKVESLNFHFL